MQLLGALFISLFSGFASFLAAYVSKKVAFGVAGAALIGTCIVALLATMRLVVAPLAAAVFSTQYGALMGMVFPPISTSCLAAYAAVWSACVLYGWQRASIAAFQRG